MQSEAKQERAGGEGHPRATEWEQGGNVMPNYLEGVEGLYCTVKGFFSNMKRKKGFALCLSVMLCMCKYTVKGEKC